MKYLLLTLIVLTAACKETQKKQSLDMTKVYAWCIVPYDSLKRSPAERMAMLKRLGIKKYAYDWRAEHLPQMAEELQLAAENGIEVIAVWMWIDNNSDSTEKLSDANEQVFSVIGEVGYKGQIWVSFNANFFDGLPDEAAVSKGAEMIGSLSRKANSLGCKVALYNHGDWFGEPANQIKIMKALPGEDLGLIYNFHHGRGQIDAFPELVTVMLPYLWSVNLNGVKREGPEIMTIGTGDYEKGMISLLLEKGYTGDFGVLGHVEDRDVEEVLKANLEGLERIMGENAGKN
ncbi:MAG TPA: AP endonuclease [Flavilitoribacter sp.]|mgnify:CR=1 FL=1|nr:AP endonuclease [Flavilitoribacter sp.]